LVAHSPSPLSFGIRVAASALALCACLGLSCERNQEPPGLPSPVLTDIRMQIADPDRGAAGAALAWSDPGGKASYYLVYQSFDRDSLLAGSLGPPVAVESTGVVLPLPDSTRPFTVIYAVRAVRVEATGQKLVSDTLLADSLTVTPSLNILAPAAASYQSGRTLDMQVQTASDPGVAIRMAYFEKDSSGWDRKADTCLPTNACGRPIFGHSVQQESLVLEQRDDSDTMPALFCVIGTESFQGRRTGLAQSLGCTRFFRIGP
jgi:hypothetical protein